MLDNRSASLLEILKVTESISNRELQSSLELSRRQVDYAINKLNNWLENNSLDTVIKSNGKISISDDVKSSLDILDNTRDSEYILSEKERIAIIYTYITSRDEYISLEHLVQLLDVSKNTVLRDLKVLSKDIEEQNIKVAYSRLKGYKIEGIEWDIRNRMFKYIDELIHIYDFDNILKEILSITAIKIDDMINKLSDIESILEREFVDHNFFSLPYKIFAIFNRIESGNTLENPLLISGNSISDTKEYEASEILCSDLLGYEEERIYLSLQLLSTPVHSKKDLIFSLPDLKNTIKQCVDNFEKIAVVNLSGKQNLIHKLYTHIKPAYYRIKFNLTTDYSFLKTIDKEYQKLLVIVKESFEPLEKFIRIKLPDEELILIALFFGGTLIEKNEIKEFKPKRAIVVCSNGITISNLLEKTLITLLPEIYFEGTKSIRQFESSNEQYDFIFSQVQLQTDQNVIYIGDLSTKAEQFSLRRRVVSDMYGLTHLNFDTKNLLEVIKNYAEVKDENSLESALNKFFADKTFTYKEEIPYKLSDILPVSNIIIKESVDSLKDAIIEASQPLLKQGIINQNYINEMVMQYPEIYDHILLRTQIAIPHADIESGSFGLGFSFLKLNQPIMQDGRPIHFICVIAAKDKNSHLDGILKLIQVAENMELIEKLKVTENPDLLHQFLIS
ncbi:BglG family transcription antiterminator [Macrococcus armenti]|uniref:BglG family transcription antiterminator n=1 Tax=Macrococcus armenti TaxID=2875764 RepID=UPI001CCD2DF2|nr:BglG family transcription antiterminator [Macrococcus armenti]UBH08058.1 BglG family transcription antiterminator [Macrococcus armenti]UBH10290.1 BglG family transcription antiterminator [Macrococcus armenti]